MAVVTGEEVTVSPFEGGQESDMRISTDRCIDI